METAIWIIIAVGAGIIGYVAAMAISKKNAKSAAGIIIEDARREADIIKEKTLSKPRKRR